MSLLDNNLQMLQQLDNSHQGFDVIREQEFDMIKGENFIFENNTLNESMLNVK